MLEKDLNFLIAGVGGQGTVVASDILSDVGSENGYDVKKSDILGLAVRGGSVVSHVRWAEKVHAPMMEEGGADYLIGFEWLETLRRLSYIRPEGTIVVNDCRLDPIMVSSGEAEYPEKEVILERLKKAAKRGPCHSRAADCPRSGKCKDAQYCRHGSPVKTAGSLRPACGKRSSERGSRKNWSNSISRLFERAGNSSVNSRMTGAAY